MDKMFHIQDNRGAVSYLSKERWESIQETSIKVNSLFTLYCHMFHFQLIKLSLLTIRLHSINHTGKVNTFLEIFANLLMIVILYDQFAPSTGFSGLVKSYRSLCLNVSIKWQQIMKLNLQT